MHSQYLAVQQCDTITTNEAGLTRSRAAGQELHLSHVAPLLLLQSLRLFLHLQLLNPGLDGRQLLRKGKKRENRCIKSKRQKQLTENSIGDTFWKGNLNQCVRMWWINGQSKRVTERFESRACSPQTLI